MFSKESIPQIRESKTKQTVCNDETTDPNQAFVGNLVGKLVSSVLPWIHIKQDVAQYLTLALFSPSGLLARKPMDLMTVWRRTRMDEVISSIDLHESYYHHKKNDLTAILIH